MGSLILSFRNITPLIAPQDYFTQYYASRWKVSPKTLGNFNNDGDGDGDGSENVTFKMNSRLLKRSRIHWISMKRSKVSEFPWSWIHLGTALKFRKRKKNFHVVVVHKFRVHPCILIKLCCLLSLSLFFFQISICISYCPWSEVCMILAFPPIHLAYFLISGHFLRTPDNSNCFQYSKKVRIIGSRL